MRRLFFPKSTIPLVFTGIMLLVSLPAALQAQSAKEVKEKVNARIKAVKDSIASKHIYFTGRAAAQFNTTYSQSAAPAYDYLINTNLEAKYKGIRLPFQYVLSNGRSVYRFQGPTYRTPSFNKIGISPTYKGFQLHIGNRSMDFSRFTYQQVRFEGLGFQTPEKGIYLKTFRGNLKLVNPADLLYNSHIDPTYLRKTWGTLLGMEREKTAVKIILFRAEDQLDSLLMDSTFILPKENTVVSGSFLLKPTEKLSIQYEHAISALTDNALSPRVDILTPQSVHNMLGLFEKKTSSHYYAAWHAELAYSLPKQKIGYIAERVDKGYRSLGSLFFDHNFIEHRLFSSGVLEEKLTYSVSGGLRKTLTQQDTLPSQSKFIFQSTLSYQWNDRLTSFGSFNNFKTVQQEYYRSFQSNTIDSLSLSQVNTAFAFGSAYIIKAQAPIQLNVLLSTQQSNGIENEIVSNQNSRSHLFSLGYNQQFEKRIIQTTLSYISTTGPAYENRTWQASLLYGWTITEKIKANANFQYQSIHFGPDKINQLIQRNTLDITLTQHLIARVEAGIEFSDHTGPFRFERMQLKLDTNYKF